MTATRERLNPINPVTASPDDDTSAPSPPRTSSFEADVALDDLARLGDPEADVELDDRARITPPGGGDFFGGAAPASAIPAALGGGSVGFATGNNCEGCAGAAGGVGPGTGFGPTQGPGASLGIPPNIVPPEALVNDPEWQAQLAELQQEFPELDEQELYRIIQGESGFDSTNVNPSSGATGFFQFIPDTAASLGTSTAEIQNMSPAQQLEVYGRYLRQSNYQGGPLGMIQAAPGTYRNLINEYGSWQSVPRNIEVYRYGGPEWQQNPGWRDASGRITVGGIEAYYARQ